MRAEVRRVLAAVRQVEVHVVEHVERLDAELDFARPASREGLVQAEIDVAIPRTAEGVAAGVAERAQRVRREGRRVEPARRICSAVDRPPGRSGSPTRSARWPPVPVRALSTPLDHGERQAALHDARCPSATSRQTTRVERRVAERVRGSAQSHELTQRCRRSKFAGPQSNSRSNGLVCVAPVCLFSDE